ncbi:MAG TPA: hypothetical protein VFH42_06745 [Sporolactobacillaceae bacterium]|nr:hypothetical protein [Sporolactobacillaceae bacterium]
MKKFTAKITAMIMLLSILSFSVPAFAEGGSSTPNKEVVITSLQNKDPLIVKKKIKVEVHVQTDNPNNPTKTLKDEDKALVYAFFTKGKDQRQTQLSITKNGEYDGTIQLPKSGNWKVNIMAMLPDPALGKNGTDTMNTTWNVKEPQTSTSVWVYVVSVIGALLVILIIYLLVKGGRKRKERLEADKKAKLQQKKTKKNKKKR